MQGHCRQECITLSPAKPRTITEYIRGFPRDVQERLQGVRSTIRSATPDAKETISYGIPTFTLSGRYLIYFAGYKRHIAIYPVPTGSAAFSRQLASFRTGKGTLQFTLDRPMPYGLITRIVKARMKDALARAKVEDRRKSGRARRRNP